MKDEYSIKKGIHSFSAYVTSKLAQLMSEETKPKSETELDKKGGKQ